MSQVEASENLKTVLKNLLLQVGHITVHRDMHGPIDVIDGEARTAWTYKLDAKLMNVDGLKEKFKEIKNISLYQVFDPLRDFFLIRVAMW
jgi:hypothetical protein